MEQRPKVLIVDDNLPLAEEIQKALIHEGFVVEIAIDGDEGLKKIARFQPYIVILDIDMPVMDGREMLRQLRRGDKLTRVIVLTDYEKEKYGTLKDHANLFLVKPYDHAELVAYLNMLAEEYLWLKKISDGQVSLTAAPQPSKSGAMQYGLLSYDDDSKRVRLGGEELLLTPTEKKLLIFLMRNPDHLFSADELIEQIKGYDYEGNSSNIRTTINRLRSKLKDDPKQPIYIETVRDEGYRFIAKKK